MTARRPACPRQRRRRRDGHARLSWPPGWTAGCARSPACWRRPRPCTSRRWPGSARWPSGCATPGSAPGELLEPDDPDGAALTALACAVDARLATCTNDPLSLPARLPRDLVDGLAGGPGDGPDGGIDAIEDRLAERAAARDAWADRRRAVADAVAALDALCDREAHARRAALHRVAGAVFAAPPDPRPALRRRLAASARAATGRGVPRARCPASPRTSALRRTPCAPPSAARPG